MSDWNTKIIEEFRANDGHVGGVFENRPLVLLTTTGARTGKPRVAPLARRDEGERRFVFASKAGRDTNPDWFHNILANPAVTVEAAGETYEAVAKVVSEPERTAIYARQASEHEPFAEYQRKTDRVIPVVELIRT